MEYAVPYASGPECFCAIRDLMLNRYPQLTWDSFADDVGCSYNLAKLRKLRRQLAVLRHVFQERAAQRFISNVGGLGLQAMVGCSQNTLGTWVAGGAQDAVADQIDQLRV